MTRIKNTLRLEPTEYELVNKLQLEKNLSFSNAVRKIMRETWEADGYTFCPDCGAAHKDKYCPKCGL